MSKRIVQKNGGLEVEGYAPGAKYFRAVLIPVSDLHELAKVLDRRSLDPKSCVVRGTPAKGINPRHMRRLSTSRLEDGIEIPATLVDVPHRWVLLDLDSISCPDAIDPHQDTGAMLEHVVRQHLPPAFHGVSCWWQFTGSMGFKPGLRLRLGFWLDTALTCAELKRWLAGKTISGQREWPAIDPATFGSPAQVTYVARPKLGRGVQDPVPERSGVYPGSRDQVCVPPIPLRAEASAGRKPTGGLTDATGMSPAARDQRAGAGVGFEGALAKFGDGPGLGGCYQQMATAVGRYFREHGQDADPDVLLRALTAAMRAAPWDARKHSPDYVEATIGKARGLIQEVQRRERRKTEQHSESALLPYWSDHSLRREEGVNALAECLKSFFRVSVPAAYSAATRRRLKTRLKREEERRIAALEDELQLDPFAPPSPQFNERKRQIRQHYYRVRTHLLSLLDARVSALAGIPNPVAPRLQVRASAGTGKTSQLQTLLQTFPRLMPRITVWIAVPDHALAEQAARDLQAAGVDAKLVRGRGACRPNGDGPMCSQADLADKAAQIGLPATLLCQRCPDKAECRAGGYLSQLTDRPGIYVLAQNYLTLPACPAPRPDLLIVDEAVWPRLCRQYDVPLRDLTDLSSTGPDDLKRHCSQLIRAVTGDDCLSAVRSAQDSLDDLLSVISDERKQLEEQVRAGLEALPRREPRLINRILDGVRPRLLALRGARRLVRALQRELPSGRATPMAVRYNRDHCGPLGTREPAVEIDWRASPNIPATVPVLLLDASADLFINQRIWGPTLEEASFAIERNAVVTQVRNRTFSRGQTIGSKGNRTSTEKAVALSEEISQVICQVIERHGRTAVITYKGYDEALLKPDADAVTLHFGLLRGQNAAADCAAAVIIGREQPMPDAERRALGLFAEDHEPIMRLGPEDGLVIQSRAYRMRDGSFRSAKVTVHPDPRAQRVLEQMRERESEQAIDRLRLIHNIEPKHVYVLCSVVLDITVDRLTRWTTLRQGGSNWQKAWERFGILPVSPTALTRLFPDLWPTAEAARSELRRSEAVKTQWKDSLQNDRIAYHCRLKKGKSFRVFIDPSRCSRPRERLEQLFGPIADLRLESGDLLRWRPHLTRTRVRPPSRAAVASPWTGQPVGLAPHYQAPPVPEFGVLCRGQIIGLGEVPDLSIPYVLS